MLGGGTAGFMAAVQLSRELPDARLRHIYDASRPTIGVGESTTPAVPRWLAQQTGLELPQLAQRCDATIKRAGQFEHWGIRHERFVHRFQPTGESAIHLDASKLVTMLGEFVRGEHIDGFVRSIESDGESVHLQLDDGQAFRCDYVVDARGFPREADDRLELSWIPTDTALVQFTTPLDCPEVTRNVARPHGWVFLIPLGDHTSVGYIYNRECSTREQVEQDLDALLEQEGGRPLTERRMLPFPNFTRRTMFDGALIRVGNAASFTEPLEALSIGTVVLQLRSMVQWIRGGCDRGRLASLNEGLVSYVRRNSVFLAWHYAAGAPYSTPFWSRARESFAIARACPELRTDIELFDRFVAIAQEQKVDDLAAMADRDQWMREVFGRLRLFRPFGNFSELNVAQVGHGIGYFPTETADHAEY